MDVVREDIQAAGMREKNAEERRKWRGLPLIRAAEIRGSRRFIPLEVTI